LRRATTPPARRPTARRDPAAGAGLRPRRLRAGRGAPEVDERFQDNIGFVHAQSLRAMHK
jgi:hypothetical protein